FQVAVGADVTPSPTGEFKVVSRVENPTYYHPGTVIPQERTILWGRAGWASRKRVMAFTAPTRPDRLGALHRTGAYAFAIATSRNCSRWSRSATRCRSAASETKKSHKFSELLTTSCSLYQHRRTWRKGSKSFCSELRIEGGTYADG